MLCQSLSTSRYCASSFVPSVQHILPFTTYRRAKVAGISDVITAKANSNKQYHTKSKVKKSKKNFNNFDDYGLSTKQFSKGKYGVWSLDELKPDTPWLSLEELDALDRKAEDDKLIDIPSEETTSTSDHNEDENLRLALRNANNHRVHSWNTCKNVLYTEVDNYGGKVQDQYTGEWYDFSNSRSSGFSPLSVEHIVPRSIVKKYSSVVQDLHNLIPVERGLNSRRSSFPFGDGNCSRGEQSCLVNERMVVRDEIKGFIARSVIYVFVLYEKELKARNGNRLNISAVGDIKMLVEWCLKFKPSEYELTRNTRIEKAQGNRNPFIDDTNLCKLALTIK